MTERYRRSDFGHLQVEVTYTDPEAHEAVELHGEHGAGR